MEPSLESPVAIRRRLDVLEIDGGWLVPDAPLSDRALLWGEVMIFAWVWWAISYVARRIGPKPVLRFAPGRVTIVHGCRQRSIAASHVGVRAHGSRMQLVARPESGFETLLPGPRLLPLEVAELAEILDAHVHVKVTAAYR